MTDPSHPTLRLPTTLTGGSDSRPGAPTLLSVWLPLTEVTTDNGCMMIVPRTLDRHFTNRWAYAHMRPALLGDDDGVLELRFDLQAPRVATVSTPAHPSSAPACTVCGTAGLRGCFFSAGGAGPGTSRARFDRRMAAWSKASCNSMIMPGASSARLWVA